MALRNYLYAKHSDQNQATLINKIENTKCPPERELVLEDGSRVCANCPDCPKKIPLEDGRPKIRVAVEAEE